MCFQYFLVQLEHDNLNLRLSTDFFIFVMIRYRLHCKQFYKNLNNIWLVKIITLAGNLFIECVKSWNWSLLGLFCGFVQILVRQFLISFWFFKFLNIICEIPKSWFWCNNILANSYLRLILLLQRLISVINDIVFCLFNKSLLIIATLIFLISDRSLKTLLWAIWLWQSTRLILINCKIIWECSLLDD